MMRTFLRPALVLLAFCTLLCGVAYPLVVTAIAQSVFTEEANGSLVRRRGQIVGSSLVGQSFEEPRYFWGRLSATSAFPYDAAASTGSNLGPNHPKLLTLARARLLALRAFDPADTTPVPVELVTASGSGLDPHIGPAAARFQVRRVAAARGLSEQTVSALVEAHTKGPAFGVLGAPTVDVLGLNLALDAREPRPNPSNVRREWEP